MADLAIGISKTVVRDLVKRVKNAKEEEAKQWQTVERDIVFMKHEFEMMQSFLARATAAGEGRFRADVVARTWVRQVRELSDRAEDCIDYVLHLDTEGSLRTLCLRVLPSCMTAAEVLPLAKAVSDIQQLKAMVEDVSKRNMRYSGLGSGDYCGSKTVPVVPVAGSMQPGSSAASASTLLDIFVSPSDATMDKAATECLIGLVAPADHHAALRIFSVCGTGGDLGGTISIARKAYEHPAFCSEFALRAWVKLTRPFDPLGFVRSLVDQFEANSRRQKGKRIDVAAALQKPPLEELVDKFCSMKYLIVLEDVLSMAEWESARAFLPDGNNGSRVIVLTHQLEIASLCTGTNPVQVSLLRAYSPRHSVYIFYQEQQAQASGEQQAKPTAAEIMEAQASGEQEAKPTTAMITEAQASGKQQVKLETAPEIMEAEARDLQELITSWRWGQNRQSVISVCSAKSSVVKTIYYRCLEREAQHYLFYRYAWVVVPDPLDINELCRRLLWIMQGGSRLDDGENIISQCQSKLSSDSNLIFMDGLQSSDDWDSIRTKLILSEYVDCCIVVITKEKRVAQYCASHPSLECNISDQGDLTPHPLQYQRDDDDVGNNYFMKPKGPSMLADAYRWLYDRRLLARDSCEEKKLEKMITSLDWRGKHHVISVYGNTGVGKSFIVKTMYFRCIQREMREDLFGHYVWVRLPPHRLQIMEFCQKLFFAWTGWCDKEGLDFVAECSHLLSDKRQRVLIVIDGLQFMNDWDSIQASLPLANSASCIVVVTKNPTVARYCAKPEHEICRITSIEEKEARRHIREQIVNQLCEVVPAGTSGKENPKMTNEELEMLEEQVFAITNKCGRSPAVVDALWNYLVSQQGATAKIEALKRLNDNFMQELKANRALDSLLKVFTSMHSVIHDLPQVIKKCVFYLWIFHQGSSIRRDRLVRRWIAEGYSEGIDSISMAVYTETMLFDKLAELGMITKPATAQSSTVAAVNSSGTMRMSSCQVNSLFLEYITLRETEESIFLPLEVTVLEGGRSPPMTQQVGQHLAIQDWKGEKAVFDCLDFTRLRSLTVSGQWQPFYVSDMMLVLRVLDLEGTGSNLRDADLKQIVEQLPRLKFLSLRGCIDVTCLPRSVGNLRQLQALDVRGTKIVRLPRSIVKLQKLQYLRAGYRRGAGVSVPGGIGALKTLHTLGAIDLSSSCTGVAILNKLHRLQQLRKLHVSGIIKRHNRCVACFVLGGQASSGRSIRFPTNSFGELKVLEIACSHGMHVQFAEGAVPKLEKVKLYWQHGSSLQFSGLKYLTSSLKQIWLKGPGCDDTVRDTLQVQLDQQIPNNQIKLAIA